LCLNVHSRGRYNNIEAATIYAEERSIPTDISKLCPYRLGVRGMVICELSPAAKRNEESDSTIAADNINSGTKK
jgi:hypothetical protein